MKDLKTLSDYRCKKEERILMPTQDKTRCGIFQIFVQPGVVARVIADDGVVEADWEHVSVSLPNRCLTWEEMCKVKDIFFNEDEVVVQFHPKKSEYVNVHKYCLHLWRYKGEFPRPMPLSVL